LLPGRELIEEKGFLERAKELFGSYEKAEDAIDGVKSALARDVYSGKYEIAHGDKDRIIYAIKSAKSIAFGTFVVYFEVIVEKGVEKVSLWDIISSSDEDENL
jgi:hypothetical protein